MQYLALRALIRRHTDPVYPKSMPSQSGLSSNTPSTQSAPAQAASAEDAAARAAEFRKLPAVDALLRTEAIQTLVAEYGSQAVMEGLHGLLHDARATIRSGGPAPAPDHWAEALAGYLAVALRPTLRPVINATGVIIHTNLGRAPLSQAAQAAVVTVTTGYSNLEYDLVAGARGSRHDHARELLCAITGAEDAMVVNNNAAAVFLTLAALCSGREVLISRGQLVEIGGGFRIPDVLRQSGARLVEVGTTNRTHVRDYAQAIGPETAALMRVHASNFRQIGFVTEPSLAELAQVAHDAGKLNGEPPILIDDLGSGTLLDTQPYGLAREPLVQESLAAGADIVTFSGDKLLGGPQAGFIIGRSELVARIRRHPLARALRVDKMTLAALEATLRSYRRGRALDEIPIWRMISARAETLAARAEAWQQAATEALGVDCCELWPAESAVGGGSLPGETLPTTVLAVSLDKLAGLDGAAPDTVASNTVAANTVALDAVAAALRRQEPPVICRIQRDHLLFDPRTVLPEQDATLCAALIKVLSDPALRGAAHEV